jgi:hypothetical protein
MGGLRSARPSNCRVGIGSTPRYRAGQGPLPRGSTRVRAPATHQMPRSARSKSWSAPFVGCRTVRRRVLSSYSYGHGSTDPSVTSAWTSTPQPPESGPKNIGKKAALSPTDP